MDEAAERGGRGGRVVELGCSGGSAPALLLALLPMLPTLLTLSAPASPGPDPGAKKSAMASNTNSTLLGLARLDSMYRPQRRFL